MYCSKCGNKLEDGTGFCGECGAAIKIKGSSESVEEKRPKPGKRPLVVILSVLIVLVLGGAAGIVYINRNVFSQTGTDDGREETLSRNADETEGEEEPEDQEHIGETDEREADEENAPLIAQSELSEQIMVLNQTGDSVISIDVFADRYTPGERNTNYEWDRILFYTLEDVDPNSAADGKINGYDITRKMLRNAASGNKMEYEIYTNPSTGKVNKIASIEYMSDCLEITDYYYDDMGKVSFIFVHKDVNYIPSYAVPTKEGQRFYFNSDCMVKWRVVGGGVQSNYVVGSQAGKNNPGSSVFVYADLDEGVKNTYDVTEKKMINAAYNTYNSVLEAEGVSEITGYIYDHNGNARSGAEVTLYTDEEYLYQTETDVNGLYGIIVPSDDRDYRLSASGEGCVSTNLYNIKVNEYVLSDYQEAVYMVEESDETYDVNIQMYDALNYSSDGRSLERMSDAAIYIRDGMNHREGNVVAQATADAAGEVTLSLKPGMYTAEVVKQGYDKIYNNFAVKQNMQAIQISSSPTLASGEVRIVLTWGENPADLDSHLFTPYDSSFGDATYHIWYGNKSDAVGDNLDVDDTDGYGPETMTIPVLKDGLYKYYIADFTNCSAGNPTSYEMSLSGATVNVYTSAGLTATFHVPANVSGAIWEVFEIRNGAIVPIQRYYSNIDDKSWWHNDK